MASRGHRRAGSQRARCAPRRAAVRPRTPLAPSRRPRRPCRDASAPSAPRASRTPPGGGPSRAGRAPPSSQVPCVALIGPRKPSSTTCGIRPQWSRWAWVRRIASSVVGSKPNGIRLRTASFGLPWNIPQSIEHAGSLGDEQELGAGDGRGAAEEVDLHRAHRATPRRWRGPRGLRSATRRSRGGPAGSARRASRAPAGRGHSHRAEPSARST